MRHQIVFSDIDGTLLNKERELSNQTIATIEGFKEKIPFILISSRMPKAMCRLQKTAGIENLPLVAYNGGLLLHGNTVIESISIPLEILSQLIEFNSAAKVHLSLYNNDDWYVPRMDYWAKREINNTKITPQLLTNNAVLQMWTKQQKGAHKIMCMGDSKAIDQMQDYLEANFEEQLQVYRSKSTYIEIADKRISKKTAILRILENLYPEIPLKNAVAFGDNFNDQEMLNAVGTGVAVANAKPSILKIADEITDTNLNDGVARWLNKNLKL